MVQLVDLNVVVGLCVRVVWYGRWGGGGPRPYQDDEWQPKHELFDALLWRLWGFGGLQLYVVYKCVCVCVPSMTTDVYFQKSNISHQCFHSAACPCCVDCWLCGTVVVLCSCRDEKSGFSRCDDD